MVSGRDDISQSNNIGPKSFKSHINPFNEGWSKTELIEAEEIKMLRRETQTALLGSVFLLVITQVTLALILLYQLFNLNMKPISA